MIKFLKPSKNKIELFLYMIFLSFLVSLIYMFLTRFMVEHSYYKIINEMIYEIYYFIIQLLRYFLIAYLSIAFIRNDYSINKEIYNIFKVVILFYAISFLHSSLVNYIYNTTDIVMLSWVQYILAASGLMNYYIVACYVYGFKK